MPARPIPINDIAGVETHGEPDPGISSEELAASSAIKLLDQMTDQTIARLTKTRDRIDRHINALMRRKQKMAKDWVSFKRENESALTNADSIDASLDAMTGALGEAVPDTVTHIRHRLNEQD